jgi:hypothetical protein
MRRKRSRQQIAAQMLRRSLITSALAVTGLAVAAPAGASAATTLGETFPPMADLSCGGPNYEVVQVHRASGTSYAAPSAGVLTSWSFEASTLGPTTLTLRVYRPTGTPQQYTPIAEAGTPQTFTASSGLHTSNVQIPVQTGDLIGIHSTNGPCGTMTFAGGDVYDAHAGTPGAIPIGTPTIFSEGFQLIFDISAKLEPDCDNDGQGDESQDSSVTAACPVPPSPGTNSKNGQQGAKKKCKKKHKKHKRSAQSAKKKKCKKKKKRR